MKASSVYGILFSTFVALGFSPASAQQFKTSTGDQRVGGEQLKQLVHGKTLRDAGGNREVYRADGSYSYQARDGQNWNAPAVTYGKDGIRCIKYPNGDRCDLYVVNDRKLVLINMRGERYPMTILAK